MLPINHNTSTHTVIESEKSSSSSLPIPSSQPQTFNFRIVFKTNDQMKKEFGNFLKTIFYQLDETKVFQLMDEICAPGRNDEEIYNDLLARIDATKKSGSILYKIWSLFVVQKGMAKQANELLKTYSPEGFQNYMEIYDRRYLTTIRKVTGLPLNGKTIALTDADGTNISLKNRLEAWAIKFPYNTHVKISEKSDKSPLLNPEITYPPLGSEIDDNSVDLVTCIGGMHHTPKERLEPFLDSLNQKMKPGGIVLLREHDLSQSDYDVFAMAYVVHSFVNAADGVPTNIEQKEVREFKPVPEWNEIMKRHGFTHMSEKGEILKDDPTQNALHAYMKTPTNLEELKITGQRFKRSEVAQKATWIEWANVRMSDDYGSFVQDNHSYAFDFVGHLKQHWTHFYNFVKDTNCTKSELIFSDGMLMNLFIAIATTVQCGAGALTSLPSQCIARVRYGKEWREVKDISGLEKYQAKVSKEYADFLHHTPWYCFPFLSKIKGLWTAIYKSDDSYAVKFADCFSALSQSASYLLTSLFAAAIKGGYVFVEQPTVKVIVHDPENKVPAFVNGKEIKTMFEVDGGYKMIAVPRYKDFKTFCQELPPKGCRLVQVAGQETLSVDIWSRNKGKNPNEIYRVKELNVKDPRILKTYEVPVAKLNTLNPYAIEHVHE